MVLRGRGEEEGGGGEKESGKLGARGGRGRKRVVN